MRLRFSGGRALILGGSCDLGISLAIWLADQGVMPVLTFRNHVGRQRIEAAMAGKDRPFECLALDLGSDEPCSGLPEGLALGVDYLIDFAQEELESLVASADPIIAKRYFQANLGARFEVLHRVARKMIASRKGRMVFISSTAAGRPNPGQGFYAAAKQGAEALYRNVGLELASRGITTVTLRPGYIDTGRGHRYLEQKRDDVLAKIPLGRVLAVQEVVETIGFLLSDSAQGINATIVTMDGGLSAGK